MDNIDAIVILDRIQDEGGWSNDAYCALQKAIDTLKGGAYLFSPATAPPRHAGHYLTISNMNWYHGGCFDDDRKTGLSLSYKVAYYNNGWNDPFVVAWADLPDFPEEYKEANLKLLEERRKNLKPAYGTECYIG